MPRVPAVFLVPILLACLAGPAAAQGPDHVLHLAVGDPARRDREVPVVLDAVTDTRTGEVITPAVLVERLAGTRLLLVGETHTSQEVHRVQFQIIEELHRAGRRVLIGLEMFPYTEQAGLDQWRDGLLTEEGFLRLSRWYEHWGYHWLYYRDIFLFARDNRLPLHAVNAPRDVVAAVRRKGFANLSPEEAAHLPTSVDVESADHLAFFKASFGEGDALHGGLDEEAWRSMLAAQATWDATMGFNAVKALERSGHPDAVMVVLVGSGHVAYGLGIERQARRWFDGRIASVIPVPVWSPAPGRRRDTVRASYADFVWGVAGEPDSTYPTLGVSTRTGEGGRCVVINVEPRSAAARAGVQVGDILASMDGTPITDRETLNRLVATKRWGDTATLVVDRGGTPSTLALVFRRTIEPGPGESPAPGR
jgi:aminopeptidase N